ncbi:substrate-binding domain-containing protein [Pelosinus propionicus]|uniref:Transcriptional regulator, LacI family n=1 Tax=Pelosinus propionicus DSM 13327 TaxID=1123291 RepID=A0A1I4MJX1_9FIRM|nr:substrate-binding domain-containing protein [Pelosinus propionicus]SFM03346.1 transcriptional regulator, LacI family [Pelosinus propionicus DSM 13327]
MATIKDVAALSGVSVSTVSIILNGKAKDRKISVETQDKIMEAIKALNYRPSVSAKKLRSPNAKEYTIALYWASDFRTNYLARLISGFQSEISNYQYPINIVICPYRSGSLFLEKGLQSDHTFNAAIIANTSISDMEYLNNNLPKIPTVLYNRYSEQYNTVTIDNFEVGRKAAMLLINKGIKDNIGLVHFKAPYLAMTLRSQGFIDTCIKHSIQFSDENVINTEGSIQGGVLAAEIFLKRKHLPKAIFCDSDSLAQGLLHVFNKKNIKIPEDSQIIAVGLGSPEASQYSTPPLTVVEIPLEKMAAECLRLIINVLEHRTDTSFHVNYESKLIIRDSCS